MPAKTSCHLDKSYRKAAEVVKRAFRVRTGQFSADSEYTCEIICHFGYALRCTRNHGNSPRLPHMDGHNTGAVVWAEA